MIASSRSRIVTHQQIADKLGVSRQLVTHSLNRTRHTRISAEMRERVKQVAHEMGYQPRARTTHNIGYILPLDSAYLEAEHLLSLDIERAARAAGYRLLVAGIHEPAELAALPDIFNVKTVDGVISPRWFNGIIGASLPADVPLLLTTDEYNISDEYNVICTDAHATFQIMTEYLLARGHRCIGLAIGNAEVKQHNDAMNGVLDALAAQGLSETNLRLARGTVEELTVSIPALLQDATAPTAWLASSATYTMAILYGLYRLGFRVPEDISIISFMDSPSFAAMPMELTTTDALGKQIAERIVTRLITQINNPELPPVQQYFPAQIIDRTSVMEVLHAVSN